jgi:major outer membrane protein
MAADLAPRAFVSKAPYLEPALTWWVEGGLQAVDGGDPGGVAGLPGFITQKGASGWSIAGGVDYRLDAWWHVSAALRYGSTKSRTTNSNPGAVFGVPTFDGLATSPAAVVGSNSATHQETNWAADFMVGRDIGLGLGKSQVKFGLRVAEIRGKTNGVASWQVPTATFGSPTSTIAHTRAYQQTSRFLGGGPRLALEGSAPIGGAWFVDYMAGVAALYGVQSVNQTVTISNFGGVANCLAGCPVNFGSTDDKFVFNTDAMLGLGYAFTPHAKLSLNYRVDAYFNAMRVIDANNNVSNVNRVNHGPNLRLTVSN